MVRILDDVEVVPYASLARSTCGEFRRDDAALPPRENMAYVRFRFAAAKKQFPQMREG